MKRTALPLFIKYAGGLKSDRKSNLYKAVKIGKINIKI